MRLSASGDELSEQSRAERETEREHDASRGAKKKRRREKKLSRPLETQLFWIM